MVIFPDAGELSYTDVSRDNAAAVMPAVALARVQFNASVANVPLVTNDDVSGRNSKTEDDVPFVVL